MILLPREAGAHSRRGEAVGAGAAKAPEEEAAFDRTHGGRAGEARSNAKGAVNRKSAFEDIAIRFGRQKRLRGPRTSLRGFSAGPN